MIIKKLYLNIVFILLFLVAKNTFSQVDTTTIHKINEKEYYIHTIEAGNTLYFLSKVYNTPVDIIKKENPSVNDGLSIGEKIFIPLKRAEESINISDGNYILHTVEKGRTLYALAKEYNIQQNDIIVLNPDIVDEGIKEGQIIKIPVQKIKNDTDKPIEQVAHNNYKTHNVIAGETLYSLSKTYGVSIDSIKLVNNGLLNGLKDGEIIYLPIIEPKSRNFTTNVLENKVDNNFELETILMTSHTNDSIIKKFTYKIALLLPFYLDENDELVTNTLQQKEIYPKSKFALEFYHGVVLALDSLSKKDVNFELLVYDTKGQDSLATKKILQELEQNPIDLIIGPLYYSNFEVAAEFASNNKIPIVSPVKQNNKILLGNQFVFKAIPSKTSIVSHIAQLTVDSFNVDNLLAVAHSISKEKSLADLYVSEYNKLLMNKKDTMIYSSIKKVDVANPNEITSHINKTSNNVIFVPSTNSTFITNLFSSLSNILTSKEYKYCSITLIGLEEWQMFDNIDLEYFQMLNVYLPVNQYVNYEKEETKTMIKSYVDKTSIYPSNSSFLGFDIAYYFADKLYENGSVFNFEKTTFEPTSLNFNFIKTGVESGFENVDIHMLGIENYTLKKVN